MLLCDIIMGNPQVPVALGIGRYQLIHPLPARLKGGPLHAKGLQLLNLQGRELIAAVGRLPKGLVHVPDHANRLQHTALFRR